MEKVPSSIENLENQAEQYLEQAKKQAAEIITKSGQESQSILSSPLDLDEIKSECSNIIEKAKQESETKVNDSRRQAAGLKNTAGEKVEAIITRMTRMITEV